MNKQVSIITRAYNRLEYSIQCINLVRQNTIYPYYEHIIIDNASIDGTRSWLEYIKQMPNNWFDKVKPIYCSENHGDWGGMIEGSKYVEDSKYVVQLDNDIEVPYGWLTKMVAALKVSGQKVAMIKRTGIRQVLTPQNGKVYTTSCGEIRGGEVDTCVACYGLKADDFMNVKDKVGRCGEIPRTLNTKCFKIISITCHQMEGWDGKNYIQHKKYGKG